MTILANCACYSVYVSKITLKMAQLFWGESKMIICVWRMFCSLTENNNFIIAANIFHVVVAAGAPAAEAKSTTFTVAHFGARRLFSGSFILSIFEILCQSFLSNHLALDLEYANECAWYMIIIQVLSTGRSNHNKNNNKTHELWMQIDTNTLNIIKYEPFYNTTAISISTMQLFVKWITRFCLFVIIIFLSDLNWVVFQLGYIVRFKKCLWKYVCPCV